MKLLLILSLLSLAGCEKNEVRDSIISSYNCSERVADFIVPFNNVEFEFLNCNHQEGIQLYLAKVYPQYLNGQIEQRDGFYYVTLFDRTTIRKANLKDYYNPEISPNNKTTYTVVWNPFSLKTADGHN